MPTVLLVRHGRTSANASGVLAGWSPGVSLDETGLAQATGLAERVRRVGVVAVVSSPLERCLQTAGPIAEAVGTDVGTDDRLGEARYGDWTGRRLRDLARTKLWRVVQDHPSGAVFPGPDGEALAAVAARAVAAVRDWDARLSETHGPSSVWLAVSHGDVIKAVLADALGMHLDSFQRLVVDPCSVSVISYTPTRPFVGRVNDTGGSLDGLRGPRRRRRSSDAAVGGGAGEQGRS